MNKAATEIDAQIGARVRMHRRMRGMTQEKLGMALGLTFQQVQKYEKGTNRIGAGRLQDIANILHVPISNLFEDSANDNETANSLALAPEFSAADLSDFISSSEGLALARSFAQIGDSRMRRRVLRLVEELSVMSDASARE